MIVAADPSTLPAQPLRKAIIRAYNGVTHKADIQLIASLPTVLPSVRVATNIPSSACVIGRECSALFFDLHDPADAVVVAVQGAVPPAAPPPGAHQTTHLAGGTDALAGNLQLGASPNNNLRDSAANNRLTLAASSPHVKLTGQTHVTDSLGVSIAPDDQSIIKVHKNFGAAAYGKYGIFIQAEAAVTGFAEPVVGLFGYARYSGSAVLGGPFGLDFQGIVTSSASGANLSARGARIAVVTPGSGPTSIYGVWGLMINASLAMAPTNAWGILVANFGHAGGTTVYGLKIEDQTGPPTRYCLEVGPATPYLRVVGGWTPAANQTPIWISEGATPTLRNLQTKDGAAIGAGDRVVIAV